MMPRSSQSERPEPPAAERPKTKLVSWKTLIRGSLRGFASVELPIGLTISEIPVLVGQNGAWAALPSKPVLDRDGRHRLVGGKPVYSTILSWETRDLADKFSLAVVELVRQAHPEALDEDKP